jgi:hypothetical protein
MKYLLTQFTRLLAWLTRSPARPTLARHYSVLRCFLTHTPLPAAARRALQAQKLLSKTGRLTTLGKLFLQLNSLA